MTKERNFYRKLFNFYINLERVAHRNRKPDTFRQARAIVGGIGEEKCVKENCLESFVLQADLYPFLMCHLLKDSYKVLLRSTADGCLQGLVIEVI